MRLVLFAATIAGLVGAPVAAQQPTDPEPPVVPMSIGFDEGGLSGEGGDLLRGELDRTQFVVIGEDHGFADAPRLVSAFATEGTDLGFDDYAIEVGPYSTQWLRNVLASGGPDALADQLEGRPLALPFLSQREEAEAAMPFLGEGQLWGTDQEFIGSPLIHFEVLGAAGKSERLATLFAQEKQAFATGNQGAAFMATVTDADWEALQADFAGDDQALDRLSQLQRSTAVYRAYFQGNGLKNNLDRVELIREYFLEAYAKAETRKGAPPRVLMKFGATHASRATTPMNTFDIGALVEGMAAANGLEALHIAYLPLGGEKTAIFPSPEGAYSVQPVDGSKLRAVLEQGGVDLSGIRAGSGHHLISLEPVKRALGNKGLADLDGMARFVILGFDYLITTMDGEPATPLALK